MRQTRRIAAAAMLLLLSLAFASPALAQVYPPDGTTSSVSDTVVVPGEPITVSGDGWQPGSEVTITFFSDPEVLGTATVNSAGAFSTQVTIPADASPGQHTLRVSGIGDDGQPRQVDISITVAGAGAAGAPGPGQVAVTGTNITVGLVILAGLVVAGTVALLVGRRRAGVSR